MTRRLLTSCCSSLALLCVLGLPGCGGDDAGSSGGSTGGSSSGGDTAADSGGGADDTSDGETPVSTGPRLVDPANTGSLSGRVTLDGPAPERDFVRMIGEAWCMGEHDEGGFLDTALLVGEGGGVANAFVWIESGLDDWEFPDPEGAVVLDQIGCLYTPRVLGIQAKQELQARNSDPITHNVHTKGRKEENKSTPANDTRSFEFKRAEIMVEVVCDIHAWMKGWIGVVDHPLYAVTGADGRWSMDGVPPGTYQVGIWHEVLGQTSLSATIDAQGNVTGLDHAY